MNEIEDTNKWKDISYSQIGRTDNPKMSILSKTIYKFNAIPFKTPRAYFTELGQIILKVVGNHRDPELPK